MTRRYSLYPCSFNGGALAFTQLGSATLNPGVNLTEVHPGGSVYRHAALTAFGAPTFMLSTTDIFTPFAVPTISPQEGYECAGSSFFQYQQRDDGATFLGVGAGNHTVATCVKGYLAPTTLQATQDAPASCDFTFWPLYDGANQPVVFADVTLTGVPDWISTYYLGPCYIDDAGTPLQLPTLIDMRIEFGIDYRVKRADGDVWGRVGMVYKVAPVITLTFENVGMLDSGGAKGQMASIFGEFWGAGVTNLGPISLFLKRGSTVGAGTREIYTDADHCRIRIFQGQWHPDSVAVQEEGDTTVQVTLRPLYDPAAPLNPQIVIDGTAVGIANWGTGGG